MKYLGLALLIACFAFFPFAFIWAINELCEQGGLSFNLPYNFWTWLSTLTIVAVLNPSSSSKNK